ncbi:hypothetical protein ACIQCQ_07815 [Streptomyces sp. NPDC088394]|uniref:hypothetical protein n=1 Tax=Streptomyces sp. NPDC088394 TaxID=3365860 RepID=UPI0038056A24
MLQHLREASGVMKICFYCQELIEGAAEVVGDGFSMSGARPDVHAHPKCAPFTVSGADEPHLGVRGRISGTGRP